MALAWSHVVVAQTLPSGGTVVSGSATIDPSGPGDLTINQSSSKGIINWSDFSIGTGGLVTFQNGSGSTLNRVTGGNVSSIDGLLAATGSVYLLNSNGVVIGKSGEVDVGGSFVAATGNISNDEFLAGGDLRFRGNSDAAVVNLGSIGSLGGDIALIGAHVDNQGTISAPNGNVGLIAGHDVVMRDKALDDGQFLVNVGGSDTSVNNSGTIDAAMAELRAEGGNVYALAGNTDGVVRATGVTKQDGRIFLSAGSTGSVAVENTEVRAKGSDGDGGEISVTGGRIEIAQDATLDASAHGASGDGGDVVVIADMDSGDLDVEGRLITRGGIEGGDGGFVETSGANVDFTGVRIDASAPNGATGLWLIDPYDLTVDATAASTISTNLATANVTLQTTAGGVSGPGVPNPDGNGDIFVNAPISWSSGNTLTLNAYRNVAINAAIEAGNTGDVVLITGDTNADGVSDSAIGDYSFGLGPTGFAGKITFGSSVGSATLNIGTGGAATASYTLIYALPTSEAVSTMAGGNYALANSLTDTVTRSIGVYDPGANRITFTGLGNTVSGLDITGSTLVGSGFFRRTQAGSTIRDIGLVSGTVSSSAGSNIGGLIGAATNTTIKNSYANLNVTTSTGSTGNVGGLVGGATSVTIDNVFTGGTVSTTFAGGNSQIGGLIGSLTASGSAATVTNAHSSASVSAGGFYSGGLVGRVTGVSATASVTISDSYATGTVNSTSGTVGGLAGSIEGSYTTLADTYTTGQITGTSNVGGLVGRAVGTTAAQLITGSYASGHVNGSTNVGGLVGEVYGPAVSVTSVHATGDVTGTGTTIGGLIGRGFNGMVSEAYATGAVSGTTSVGGFIGEMNGFVVNTSFATGNVTGTSGYLGGFAGLALNYSVITDAYALGDVHATAAMAPTSAGVGGFLGSSRGGSTTAAPLTLTNVHAAGAVTTDVATNNTGGLIGNVYNAYTLVTNGYWDTDTTGQTTAGANTAGIVRYEFGDNLAGWNSNTVGTNTGGARTTEQMTDGSMPAGFNTASSGNGNPWRTGNGLYPYFAGYVPDGAQLISGTAYLVDGQAAGSSSITIYFDGGILASGIMADAVTGAYSTFVGADTIGASSALGGTLTLNGGSGIVGATYTDTPTLSSGDVVGFDIRENLVRIATADVNSSTLVASLDSTFGASAFGSIATALDGADWRITAGGDFTLDSAISHAGSVTLESDGALTIGASGSVTSTTGGVTLAANGAFVNQAGASAVTAATRWLIYSQATDDSTGAPTFATADGLSGKAFYGDAYTFTTANAVNGLGDFASTPNSGNRFVYGYLPTLTVAPQSTTVTYNGALQTGTFTIDGYIGSDQAADTLTGTVNGPSGQNAGTYTQTATGTLVSDLNYAVSYASGTLTIDPAALTVTAADDAKTYDAAAYSGGNGVSYAGFVDGETSAVLGGTLAYGGTAQGAVNAGSYTITASGLSSTNYDISYVDGALTIGQAALAVSTSDVAKTYDGTVAASGAAIVINGVLYSTDSLSGGSFAFADPNAGTGKTVTVSGVLLDDGNNGNNYIVTYVANTGSTINQATLLLAATSDTKTYDGTETSDGAVVASGLKGSDTVMDLSQSFDRKDAGSRILSVNGDYIINDGNDGANYIVATQDAPGTIGKATITVTGTDGYSLTGVVPGDNVGVTGQSGRLDLTGPDAPNYTINDQTSANGPVDVGAGGEGGFENDEYCSAVATEKVRLVRWDGEPVEEIVVQRPAAKEADDLVHIYPHCWKYPVDRSSSMLSQPGSSG